MKGQRTIDPTRFPPPVRGLPPLTREPSSGKGHYLFMYANPMRVEGGREVAAVAYYVRVRPQDARRLVKLNKALKKGFAHDELKRRFGPVFYSNPRYAEYHRKKLAPLEREFNEIGTMVGYVLPGNHPAARAKEGTLFKELPEEAEPEADFCERLGIKDIGQWSLAVQRGTLK